LESAKWRKEIKLTYQVPVPEGYQLINSHSEAFLLVQSLSKDHFGSV
jgi:hypothetical protein